MNKIISLGLDHGGFTLKQIVIETIKNLGYTVRDNGIYEDTSVDYPDYACLVAKDVLSGNADLGILICGTGIGISIAANKFKGIRCANVYNEFTAKMAKEHNNANVISLGGRTVDACDVPKILKAFLSAEFLDGRHGARVNKIMELEKW